MRIPPIFKIMESNNYLSWTNLLTCFYSATLLWVGLVYFEPWRDLAHAWVSVRDLGFTDIFTTIPAHSHPFLWFLLLKPLVLLGLPYLSSVILNITFCILGVYIFVSKCPLPWWIKVLFICSFPMIYEFAFPGRIYALGVFLSFCLCALFKDRHRNPVLFSLLIALLFHTHSLFLSISGTVALLFFLESIKTKTIFQSKYLTGFSLIAISGLYFIWYILEVNQYTDLLGKSRTPNTFLNFLSLGLLAENSQYSFLAVITLILFMISRLGKSIEIILLTLASLSFLIYCYTYITPQQIRYYQILLICMLAWWWIAEKYQPIKIGVKKPLPKSKIKSNKAQADKITWFPGWNQLFLFSLGICLFFSSFNGIKNLINEIELPHSDARNAAEFLQKNSLLDHTLIGHRSYTASSVVPYLPPTKSIWYADRKEFGTYLKFDSLFYQKNLSVNYPQAISNTLTQFGNEKKLLFIASIPLAAEYNSQWNLIYQSTQKTIQTDEVYFIYKRR